MTSYWDKLDKAHHAESPLTDAEWDERFLHHIRSTAEKTMEQRHGKRPGGPPSAADLALRMFWLTEVKRMDWKKLGFGALAAVLGAVAGAIPAAADAGISGPEAWGIGAVALGALALYLKDPNAHKGGDPRQYPGLKNTFRS
jgi:hypothetical protein